MATRSAERANKKKSPTRAASGAAKKTRAKKAKPPSKAPRRAATTKPKPPSASGRKQLAVVYDIDGPRVRLGLAWFVCAVAALVVGPIGIAVVFGVAAMAAAAQSARCWRASRQVKARPHVIGAAAFAAAIPLAAILGPMAAGVAVLALPVGALALGGAGRRPVSSVLLDAGYTIQVSLFPALAAASVVLLRDLRFGVAVLLVLAASVYECGDFLIGTGASNSYEGPAAGIAAILVVTFGFAAIQVTPFSFASAFAFGGLAAVLMPAGQLFASALLPKAWSRAPSLRRLDSLLLAGPVWLVLADLFLV